MFAALKRITFFRLLNILSYMIFFLFVFKDCCIRRKCLLRSLSKSLWLFENFDRYQILIYFSALTSFWRYELSEFFFFLLIYIVFRHLALINWICSTSRLPHRDNRIFGRNCHDKIILSEPFTNSLLSVFEWTLPRWLDSSSFGKLILFIKRSIEMLNSNHSFFWLFFHDLSLINWYWIVFRMRQCSSSIANQAFIVSLHYI